MRLGVVSLADAVKKRCAFYLFIYFFFSSYTFCAGSDFYQVLSLAKISQIFPQAFVFRDVRLMKSIQLTCCAHHFEPLKKPKRQAHILKGTNGLHTSRDWPYILFKFKTHFENARCTLVSRLGRKTKLAPPSFRYSYIPLTRTNICILIGANLHRAEVKWLVTWFGFFSIHIRDECRLYKGFPAGIH